MSSTLISVLEQRVGYDVRITELREGRLGGPPRARGRRVFVFGNSRGFDGAIRQRESQRALDTIKLAFNRHRTR